MLRYIRGVERIKDYCVKFFKYIFYAENKGQIQFYDGDKLLKFSQMPTVVKKNAWDFRNLPCILIGSSSGDVQTISFQKDFIAETLIRTDDGEAPSGTRDFYETGGEISLSVDLDIYANTLEERDKLVDLVAVYLSGPTAKDYFMRQYIRLPKDVRIREGGTINVPSIDTPVYYSTVSFDAVGTWRDREYYGERLLDIIISIEFEMEYSNT
jgi:hypothetical protein